MGTSAQGRCLCGASRYSFVGEVKFALQCHCRDCQYISGGGHLPQIAVPADQFETFGKIKIHEVTSDAGNLVSVSFCEVCGSPLFKTTSKMPDVRFLCAGSLNEDLVTEPLSKVFEQSRRPWDG